MALSALALLAAVACRGNDAGRSDAASADAAKADAASCGTAAAAAAGDGAAPAGVTALAVNHGTHGMTARVRWTLSPDRCAVLVVEDPAGVENDPVPNGFLLAAERDGQAFVVQRDSAWDVAPSPDWSRLAYGRAYGLPGGERDSVGAAEWAELGRRAGLDAEVVRRGAFPSSGMTMAYAVARPVIVELSGAERALPLATGWRVRWARDGRALVLGGRPARATDDAPPTRWDVVDAGTAPARSASERAQSLGGDVGRAEVEWTAGPTIDIAAAPELDSAAAIPLDGGRVVESRGGTIRVVGPARGAAGAPLAVGPGVALAATRGGRFVVALAPAESPAPHEPRVRLVVYRVERPGAPPASQGPLVTPGR